VNNYCAMANSSEESRACEAHTMELEHQACKAAVDAEGALAVAESATAETSAHALGIPEATQEASTVIESKVVESSETPEGTSDEEVSRVSAAIARATRALEEVRSKVYEYDAQCKASETAASYLGGPIQKAQKAFDDLAATTKSLKDRTVQIPTKAFSRALDAANSALEQMTDLASKYDEKFQVSSKVQTAVSIPQEKCRTALTEVSNLATSASTAAHAQLQDASHGISSRVAAIANSGAGLFFSNCSRS